MSMFGQHLNGQPTTWEWITFLGGPARFPVTHTLSNQFQDPKGKGEPLIPKPGPWPKVGGKLKWGALNWKLPSKPVASISSCFLTGYVTSRGLHVRAGYNKKEMKWSRQELFPSTSQQIQTNCSDCSLLLHQTSLLPTRIFCQLIVTEWSLLATKPHRGY